MHLLLIGLAVLAALVIILLIVVSLRPNEFHVERSATVAALPHVVFPLINDFHEWGQWSPWDKMDPTMKRTYSGTPSGVGAIYSWVGNGNVGEGRMAIEEVEQDAMIVIKLEFFKPFAGTNRTVFTLAPAVGGTKVTWSMDGTHAFVPKLMSLVMSMDKMIGGPFEKGLADLDKTAQAKAE